MLELQVPLLAAKALLLLLLFAFIYVVVRRGIGDLREVPDENDVVESPSKEKGFFGGRQSGKPKSAPEIIVEDSNVFDSGKHFVLSGDTSIGRSSASDITLTNDDYASGKHARLTRHGGLLYIEDLGSTNGTFVNGNKAVGATPLRDGDAVKIGSTTFRFME